MGSSGLLFIVGFLIILIWFNFFRERFYRGEGVGKFGGWKSWDLEEAGEGYVRGFRDDYRWDE